MESVKVQLSNNLSGVVFSISAANINKELDFVRQSGIDVVVELLLYISTEMFNNNMKIEYYFFSNSHAELELHKVILKHSSEPFNPSSGQNCVNIVFLQILLVFFFQINFKKI